MVPKIVIKNYNIDGNQNDSIENMNNNDTKNRHPSIFTILDTYSQFIEPFKIALQYQKYSNR